MTDKPKIQVVSTPPFKLKDKAGRNYQFINLKKQFGFIPEVIIIEKVRDHTNVIIVRAVLTEEEIKKDKEKIKEVKKA
jgi:hypothetical protein